MSRVHRHPLLPDPVATAAAQARGIAQKKAVRPPEAHPRKARIYVPKALTQPIPPKPNVPRKNAKYRNRWNSTGFPWTVAIKRKGKIIGYRGQVYAEKTHNGELKATAIEACREAVAIRHRLGLPVPDHVIDRLTGSQDSGIIPE